jgi:hypothetical protein
MATAIKYMREMMLRQGVTDMFEDLPVGPETMDKIAAVWEQKEFRRDVQVNPMLTKAIDYFLLRWKRYKASGNKVPLTCEDLLIARSFAKGIVTTEVHERSATLVYLDVSFQKSGTRKWLSQFHSADLILYVANLDDVKAVTNLKAYIRFLNSHTPIIVIMYGGQFKAIEKINTVKQQFGQEVKNLYHFYYMSDLTEANAADLRNSIHNAISNKTRRVSIRSEQRHLGQLGITSSFDEGQNTALSGDSLSSAACELSGSLG